MLHISHEGSNDDKARMSKEKTVTRDSAGVRRVGKRGYEEPEV